MATLQKPFRQLLLTTQTMVMLLAQVMHNIRLRLRSRAALAAEHLFLKQQLALYQKPKANCWRDMNATRFTLVWLSYWFDWQTALTIVNLETFKRWRRQGWHLLCEPSAKPGRPPIPTELQTLIRRMARENVTRDQKRIANECLLKLGLRVSPRTVRKYMPSDCVGSPGRRCQGQRWSTFIRNHARGLILGGVRAQITQRVKAVMAHIRDLIPSCLGRAPLSASSSIIVPLSTIVCAVKIDGICGVKSLKRTAWMKDVKRSPSVKRSSRHGEWVRAVEAGVAVRIEVGSVIPVRSQRRLVRLEA